MALPLLAGFALPAFVKRFLPHALIVIIIVAALGGLVWYLDHKGYQRAKADAERAKIENALIVADIVLQSERRMGARLSQIDTATTDAIAAIDVQNRTIIQPTLRKELTRETRFTDPAAGLTVGLRDTINAARRLSGATTPASELSVALSAPISAE